MRSGIAHLLAGTVLTAAVILLLAQGKTATTPQPAWESQIITQPPPHRPLIIGELAAFEAKAGLESLKNNAELLDSVSLFWYEIQPDATLKLDPPATPVMEDEALATAAGLKLEILLGIGNDGNPDRLNELLLNPATQQQVEDTLLTLVEEKGYDGIALDFEGLLPDQTRPYTEFVRTLASMLRARGKKLTVAANTELSGRIYDGIDILAVSRYADRLDLNSFEEYGEWSGPGPIASINWVARIVANVLAQGVPREKVVLGTAHSGHDWVVTPEVRFVSDVTTRVILDLLRRTGAELQFDDQSRSNYFRYQDRQGRDHLVWLEDGESLAAKLELAQRERLGGIFIWFLGGEEPGVWDVIREFKRLN